jgi:formyl-CoA transferase
MGALPGDTAYRLNRVGAAGVPAAPILTYDRVYANPQARARGMVVDTGNASTPLVDNPVRMSLTPW